MKDKERIRAFCDDLAKQWEENCPELGAYQVIVNLYRRLRTFLLFNDEVHNMFLLWEMQRYFGTEMPEESAQENSVCNQLTLRWQSVAENLQGNADTTSLNLPFLKTLLLDSWEYFTKAAKSEPSPIALAEWSLLQAMSDVSGRDGPSGIPEWEYDAFTDILNGIIETVLNNPLPLCSNVSILDGYIIAFVPHDINSDTETALHISDFNFIFDDLAKRHYNLSKERSRSKPKKAGNKEPLKGTDNNGR